MSAQPSPSSSSAGAAVRGAAAADAADEIRRGADESEAPVKATRISDRSWLGGVCVGLSRHLGWPVLMLRTAFVVLALAQFLGVVVYGVLWLFMPPDPGPSAPGLRAHSRTGMRTAPKIQGADVGSIVALAAIGVGGFVLLQLAGIGIAPLGIYLPAIVSCVGAALLWRQADMAAYRRQLNAPKSRPLLIARVPAALRMLVGLLLVGGGITVLILGTNSSAVLPQVLACSGLLLVGIAVVVAPWVYQARQALTKSREAIVRADARADMAAHLHDSVLQTLALIQRRADRPAEVQRLARKQERELRSWLYSEELTVLTFKAALLAEAAKVEDERGVSIEVVVVGGDLDLTQPLRAVVQSAGEAMVNAAKHSQTDSVDVYAEAELDRVEVFVRDRGVGFAPDAVAPDRQGIKGSIMDRMARHGGIGKVRSTPGAGTEVRLEMPL